MAPTAEEKALPRDILLAKARAYRESQAKARGAHAPEQLAMDVESGESALDMARRLAQEVVKSPFDTKSLDVPTYLRRKQQGEDQSETQG